MNRIKYFLYSLLGLTLIMTAGCSKSTTTATAEAQVSLPDVSLKCNGSHCIQ